MDVLVEHLVEVHGSVSTPSICFILLTFALILPIIGLSSMREVVVVLGNNYPKMFQDTGHEGTIDIDTSKTFKLMLTIIQRTSWGMVWAGVEA